MDLPPRPQAEHYRAIESLREYLLVSRDEPHAERYARPGLHEWTLTEAIGIESHLTLDPVGCVLPLSEVYADLG